MSRVTGLASSDGTSRSSTAVNTVNTALEAASATIDGTNLAEEGLDVRNFTSKILVDMETTGTYPMYIERNTDTSVNGSASYAAEAATVLSMGGNVELDWGTGITLAGDEYLVIEATLHFAQAAAYGMTSAGGGAAAGISAVIITDQGAGYVVRSTSRHRRYGSAARAADDNILGDAFDLTPTHIISGIATVKKVGVALGVTGPNPTARLSHAQILCRRMYKVQ